MKTFEETLRTEPHILVEAGDKICLVPTTTPLGRATLRAIVAEHNLKLEKEKVRTLKQRFRELEGV